MMTPAAAHVQRPHTRLTHAPASHMSWYKRIVKPQNEAKIPEKSPGDVTVGRRYAAVAPHGRRGQAWA